MSEYNNGNNPLHSSDTTNPEARYTQPQPPLSQYPCALATVLPGQLPVCWFIPVNSLNTVDLPTFGLPASATTESVSRRLTTASMPSAACAPVERFVSPILSPPHPFSSP